VKKSTANQRREHILKSNFQWATIPSLTILVYLHSFSRRCLPNLRNPATFSENPNL